MYIKVSVFKKLSVFSNPIPAASYESNGVALASPGAVALWG